MNTVHPGGSPIGARNAVPLLGGVVLVIAALSFLIAPTTARTVLTLAIPAALVIAGAIEGWTAFRRRRDRPRQAPFVMLAGAIQIVIGAALLAWRPDVRTLGWILVLGLTASGVVEVLASIRATGEPGRFAWVLLGLLKAAIGIGILVAPVAAGTVVRYGVAAYLGVQGALLIVGAVRRENAGRAPESDSDTTD